MDSLFVQQFSIAGQISKQTTLICPAIENCWTKRLFAILLMAYVSLKKRGGINSIENAS